MTRPSGTMSDFSGTVEFTLESVNWEPICKLVIDENAKLRESNDTLAKMLGDRAADCYKLRELVRDWYELAVGGADSLTDWNHAQADLEQRIHELGIEVD